MKYFFVPGRKWVLSLYEVFSVLNSSKLSFKSITTGETIFIFDIESEIEKVEKIFSRLGGFTKFGVVIEDPFEYIEEFLAAKKEGKVNYAISSHARVSANELFKLGMGIKSYIKERGFSCRFVSKRGETITSAPLLTKNKVIENGFELNIIDYKKGRSWGRTIALQDFESFSKRDYDRPFSNKEKGMLPPKLSLMMVNFAGLEDGKTIWDPFCGSGTILQEALLLGFNVVGSDSDAKSIDESKGNIDWLMKEYGVKDCQVSIFQQDATHIINEKFDFDAIITEPYLGPILRSVPGEARVVSIIEGLELLYSSFLNNVSELCKSNSKIIIVIPEFKDRYGWKSLDLNRVVPSMFDIVDNEKNLHWDRPNSIIRRQINILVKK
ncbi:MAG: DNA methyltransferase [bacterium]